MLCLFFNFVGTAAYLIGVDGGGIAAFLWGGLYMLGGVPLAWFLWYRRVYSAAMKDSAFQYGLFFAMYMAHLIFVGWSVVGAMQGGKGMGVKRAGRGAVVGRAPDGVWKTLNGQRPGHSCICHPPTPAMFR